MRNAKPCGCSFSQSNSCMAGERIRVNSASSCGCEKNHYRCQESRCPRPCTPPNCPSRPCPPKPRPPKTCPRPDCEDRCVEQYRSCLRNCRRERPDRCECRNMNHECCDDFDSLYGPIYDFDFDYDDYGYGRNRCCKRHQDHDDDCCDEK
ncbi:hypothetical protein D5266_05685 [bacterium c-19]|nr:hypothetical protein [bacterium c-19]